jgi:hypothetical protein
MSCLSVNMYVHKKESLHLFAINFLFNVSQLSSLQCHQFFCCEVYPLTMVLERKMCGCYVVQYTELYDNIEG